MIARYDNENPLMVNSKWKQYKNVWIKLSGLLCQIYRNLLKQMELKR